MKNQLNRHLIERFSRQIVLKDIGTVGQKKILSSKVLIVGAGGLGCPAAGCPDVQGIMSLEVRMSSRMSWIIVHPRLDGLTSFARF